MLSDNSLDTGKENTKYMFWFFAGGETRDDRFNIFTGSFIRLMKKILHTDFNFIKGIYFKSPLRNVVWALNNAQHVLQKPDKHKLIASALEQITSSIHSPDIHLVIISSSSGSIVAAQVACYLAEVNRNRKYFNKPFHLVLGASMISTRSELFCKLISYQKENLIGIIIHEELQDEGDNSAGIGGKTRLEAHINALGLVFPAFSAKFKGPSFLNTHPEKGHVHRRRSKTIQKALDYIEVILIKNGLGGDYYKEKAIELINEENS